MAARRAGGQVTIAAWNNEKSQDSTKEKNSFWIFSPLLYQLSYPANRGSHIQPAARQIGNVIC
jgi:hypothetical protein